MAQTALSMQRGPVPAPVVHSDRDGGCGRVAGLTERLRGKLASAIAGSNRSVADVAAEYGVSWPTAHGALVAAAAIGYPSPNRRRCWGSTRPGSDRSVGFLAGSWRPSDPWMTSVVGCTPDHAGPLLGLAPGRTGGCVREWLGEQYDRVRNPRAPALSTAEPMPRR